MNPKITGRDIASPWRWGKVQQGMAWHHIIPFSLLRDVWNRLVDQHIETALPEARVAIRQYLLLSERNQPGIDSLIERMRAENTDQKRASHNQLLPLSVAEAHQLATTAVWPAWNTVEGPKQRSDDPRNRYFDRFTSGLPPEAAGRMRGIEILFGDFERFANAGQAPSAGSLRVLTDALVRARPVVYCDLPIRYRPEMWVQDGAGLWRKRRGRLEWIQ